MLIIPAIDVKGGRCVRLCQGDMSRETLYSEHPSEMAAHWASQGVQRLHVVDLDGAIDGTPRNVQHIESILKTVSIPIQVGGGIRTLEAIRSYFELGIEYVVLGTAALENPVLIGQACEEFPSRVLVGLDVKEGKVALRGWRDLAEASPESLLNSLSGYPLSGIIYTDVTKDGMMAGPNLPALHNMVASSPFPVIASGGITQLTDIEAIARLGSHVTGIIIGKALYEGTIDLKAAVAVGSRETIEGQSC